VSDHAYEVGRVPGAEQDNGVNHAVEQSAPTSPRQLIPGCLRPSSIPIGAVGRSMLARSSAGGRRPSSVRLVDRKIGAGEDRSVPERDEIVRISNGGGSGSGAPAPPPPAKVTPKGPSASLTLTGDAYSDSATDSTKNIRYNVTWSGGAKEDYLIVQWVKGYIKDSKGKPLKATQYGKETDVDFADWRIDSVDEDPAYWSNASGRWNYTVDGPNKFSATDAPGPVKTSWGVGAEAKVDFKTAVYKSADVPMKTTGTIAATPLSSFQPWAFHVVVQADGKLKH
jgi:hypothetical protein